MMPEVTVLIKKDGHRQFTFLSVNRLRLQEDKKQFPSPLFCWWLIVYSNIPAAEGSYVPSCCDHPATKTQIIDPHNVDGLEAHGGIFPFLSINSMWAIGLSPCCPHHSPYQHPAVFRHANDQSLTHSRGEQGDENTLKSSWELAYKRLFSKPFYPHSSCNREEHQRRCLPADTVSAPQNTTVNDYFIFSCFLLALLDTRGLHLSRRQSRA